MAAQRYPKTVQEVVNAVLGQNGTSATALRQVVMEHARALSCSQEPILAPSHPWQPYIATVTEHAYRVTNAQMEECKANGHSEDDIFELTIAAALGAGLARLERGLAAIEKTKGEDV